MSDQAAQQSLGRQVYGLRDRLARHARPLNYRDHLVPILERLGSLLADEQSDRQELKRTAHAIFTAVSSDWSLGRTSIGQELLMISNRVQKLER